MCYLPPAMHPVVIETHTFELFLTPSSLMITKFRVIKLKLNFEKCGSLFLDLQDLLERYYEITVSVVIKR